MRVAIIGAGMAGLTAARELHDAGLSVVVYDKGRRVGGRLSTRQTRGGFRFDHGAQYLSAKSDDYARFLDSLTADERAADWALDDGSHQIVGVPGMSAIAEYQADGLDVRQEVEITGIDRGHGAWRVDGTEYDRVVCTVPAPQAARILAGHDRVVEACKAVVMEPNLTLMIAFSRPSNVPFIIWRRSEEKVAWLARDTAKPGRGGDECWVAQASVDWSQAHLELTKDEIEERMLPMVLDLLEKERGDVVYSAAHRWRYAYASKPLGQMFVEEAGTLFAGGDWAVSARAEGAWQSGRAMATAVLASR